MIGKPDLTPTPLDRITRITTATVLAQRIDMAGLVDERVTLAWHGANSDTKAMTVIWVDVGWPGQHR